MKFRIKTRKRRDKPGEAEPRKEKSKRAGRHVPSDGTPLIEFGTRQQAVLHGIKCRYEELPVFVNGRFMGHIIHADGTWSLDEWLSMEYGHELSDVEHDTLNACAAMLAEHINRRDKGGKNESV